MGKNLNAQHISPERLSIFQSPKSTQDPIRGLERYLEEWGLGTEQELKVCRYIIVWGTHRLCLLQKLDKDAKFEVDQGVEEAKASPEPLPTDLWADTYYKGTGLLLGF